jgi:ParB family chromosome partitioning protein
MQDRFKDRGSDEMFEDIAKYSEIQVEMIRVTEQIREAIDTDSASFKALVDTIKDKGVISPIIVMRERGGYRLIAGERRYTASKMLGLPTIPAIIKEDNLTEKDILTIQLIENIQRENLNPIEEANAYVRYYRVATGNMSVEPQKVISTIITYHNSPEKLKPDETIIIIVLQKISTKSISNIEKQLSLLRLPLEAQERVKTGKLNVTKGYIFAANIDHPLFWDLFNRDIKNPFTVEGLKKAFASKKLKKTSAIGFFQRATRFYNDIEKNADSISVGQAKKLHEIMKKIEAKIEYIINTEKES